MLAIVNIDYLQYCKALNNFWHNLWGENVLHDKSKLHTTMYNEKYVQIEDNSLTQSSKSIFKYLSLQAKFTSSFSKCLAIIKKKKPFWKDRKGNLGIFYILFFLCILIHITIYRLCIYIETHKIHYTYKCVQVFIYMYVCVCMHIHMSVSLCMYLYIYIQRDSFICETQNLFPFPLIKKDV